MTAWLELDLLNTEQVLELIACIVVIVIIFGLYICMAPCIQDKFTTKKKLKAFIGEADIPNTNPGSLKTNNFFKLEDEDYPNKCNLYKSNITSDQNMNMIV